MYLFFVLGIYIVILIIFLIYLYQQENIQVVNIPFHNTFFNVDGIQTPLHEIKIKIVLPKFVLPVFESECRKFVDLYDDIVLDSGEVKMTNFFADRMKSHFVGTTWDIKSISVK